MISCVGRSGTLTFGVKRHAVNSSSLVFNSGFWIVSLPWSSALKVFVATDPLVLTVLVSSYVSGMEDRVGVRTTMLQDLAHLLFLILILWMM